MLTDQLGLGPPMRGPTDLRLMKSNPDRSVNANAKTNSELGSEDLTESAVNMGSGSFRETLKEKSQVEQMDSRRVKPMDGSPIKVGQTENESESVEDIEKLGIQQNPQKGELAKTKGMTDRQKIMLKFMDSMESELGVPPEMIVGAMANLPVTSQVKSPEYTVSQVMDKLDLEPEQMVRAEALYMSMLSDLKQLDQGYKPTNKALMIGGSMVAAPEILSSKQRREALNQSLEKMNHNFFVKNPGMSEKAVSQNLITQQVPASNSMMVDQFGRYENSKMIDGSSQSAMMNDQLIQQNFNDQFIPSPEGGNSEQTSQIPQQAMRADQGGVDVYAQLGAKLAALGGAAAALNRAIDHQSMANGPAGAEAVSEGTNAIDGVSNNVQGLMGMSESADSEMLSNGEDFSENLAEGKKSELGQMKLAQAQDFFPQPGHTVSNHEAQSASAKGLGLKASEFSPSAQLAMATDRPQQANPNVQNIMNQAQYMIKRGGGEATVRLYPEGLGELQLKVSVQNGRVNLEMATETKEAKKAIESSLADLRANLNQHKLSLDSIKVDVGNQTSQGDLQNSHKQPDLRDQQSREDARQFLGQFREGNGSNRSSFFEMPGLKAYQKRKEPEPLQPANEVQSSSRRLGLQKTGTELNVVA